MKDDQFLQVYISFILDQDNNRLKLVLPHKGYKEQERKRGPVGHRGQHSLFWSGMMPQEAIHNH